MLWCTGYLILIKAVVMIYLYVEYCIVHVYFMHLNKLCTCAVVVDDLCIPAEKDDSNNNEKKLFLCSTFYKNVSMRFTLVHWSLDQYHSCNLSQLPGEYTAPGCHGALKAFSNTISTSTFAGIHLYS